MQVRSNSLVQRIHARLNKIHCSEKSRWFDGIVGFQLQLRLQHECDWADGVQCFGNENNKILTLNNVIQQSRLLSVHYCMSQNTSGIGTWYKPADMHCIMSMTLHIPSTLPTHKQRFSCYSYLAWSGFLVTSKTIAWFHLGIIFYFHIKCVTEYVINIWFLS